jgi:ABC-type branched-subunit amino acid transport system substrate-binding protein
MTDYLAAHLQVTGDTDPAIRAFEALNQANKKIRQSFAAIVDTGDKTSMVFNSLTRPAVGIGVATPILGGLADAAARAFGETELAAKRLQHTTGAAGEDVQKLRENLFSVQEKTGEKAAQVAADIAEFANRDCCDDRGSAPRCNLRNGEGPDCIYTALT